MTAHELASLGKSPWKTQVQKGLNGSGPMFTDEVVKLYQNDTVHQSQAEVARACIQMLDLPATTDGVAAGGKLLLNAGCGTGMCGSAIDQARHAWVGTDIAQPMLRSAEQHALHREPGSRKLGHSCAGLVQQDMGQHLPFRAGLFDGAISVSALHWLLLPGAGQG